MSRVDRMSEATGIQKGLALASGFRRVDSCFLHSLAGAKTAARRSRLSAGQYLLR